MRQKHKFSNAAGVGLAICIILVTIPSCIDELYDLKNGISSEMALGGDSLAIPIGSTDTIKLSDFLNADDIKMLETMEDGGYGLTMKDSIDVEVPKIDQTSLKIENQTFTRSKSVSFGDISLKDFKIPGTNVTNNIGLSLNSISLNNFNIPAISQDTAFKVGISDFALGTLSVPSKNVRAEKNNIFSGVEIPPLPPVGKALLSIKDTPFSFSSSTSFTNTIQVPNDVTGIDTIYLKTGAKFEVSIELSGAKGLLVNGSSVIPDISINPSDLFIFNGGGGHPILFNSGALDSTNNFKQTKNLNIDAFKINEGELTNGAINISRAIQAMGSMTLNGVKIMSDRINEINDLKLIVNINVDGVVIESMKFDIPKITTDLSGKKYFNLNNNVPLEIKSINEISFQENPAKIFFELKAPTFPEMENGKITINQLSITFPDEFVLKPVSGLNGQVYTINNVVFTPKGGTTIELELSKLNLFRKQTPNGHLIWSDSIRYRGEMSLQGRIDSKNINASEDAEMGVKLSSSLTFKSAEITTNDILKDLPTDTIPISFKVDIAEQVKRLGKINLTPLTMIRININKPDLPLSLTGNNLKIIFPDLFKFKSDLPLLAQSNIYIINGDIPNYIELELESLNINKDLVNGQLTLNENIKVSGGIKLASGDVSSAKIEELNGKEMTLQASTPDLTIASTSVQLNTLQSNYTDSTTLDIEINDLPQEIVSLDSIILDDNATLELSVDITNMPDLTNPLMANMVLDFPDLLVFEPGAVDAPNRLIIKQAFAEGKLYKKVGIKRLRFDGHPLRGVLGIHDKLKFNVGVSVEEPTVNSAELNGDPISVAVQVKLSGIKFNSVYGHVNPGIDPITTRIDLTDMPDFMKGDSVSLDITKPVIALETQSNLEIPINATMTLTPMRNGSKISENEKTLTLKMPKAVSGTKSTRFWIAPDSVGMPNNYEFVQSNIQSLFKTVPDEITFTVNAEANMEEQHHIDLNADYKMKVKYDVTVPMAFGDELKVEIRDTISDLDESIGDIAFSGKGLELFGSILNSIPLELELTVTPLDEDNKPINVTPAKQLISAGTRDGGAASTEISIKLKDPDGLLKDVRGFEMKFNASSNETAGGTPIRPDNFVKADLKVRLNGGINIGDK